MAIQFFGGMENKDTQPAPLPRKLPAQNEKTLPEREDFCRQSAAGNSQHPISNIQFPTHMQPFHYFGYLII
ncbi:MAG: hypothetical protein HY842_13125 [Bacteroidetes bacterium]|nr:hypothetical protein [Bacteroidota bacterium]